jgi:hypothetical protein
VIQEIKEIKEILKTQEKELFAYQDILDIIPLLSPLIFV